MKRRNSDQPRLHTAHDHYIIVYPVGRQTHAFRWAIGAEDAMIDAIYDLAAEQERAYAAGEIRTRDMFDFGDAEAAVLQIINLIPDAEARYLMGGAELRDRRRGCANAD